MRERKRKNTRWYKDKQKNTINKKYLKNYMQKKQNKQSYSAIVYNSIKIKILKEKRRRKTCQFSLYSCK